MKVEADNLIEGGGSHLFQLFPAQTFLLALPRARLAICKNAAITPSQNLSSWANDGYVVMRLWLSIYVMRSLLLMP